MKIFVISLKNSTARREVVEREFRAQSLDFEFIDGVDGRIEKDKLLKHFNENKFVAHRGRTVEPGELGCYASHMLAWEKAVELNEPCVVLEDDFILSKQFINSIKICEQWIENRTFIRLEPWKTKLVYDVESYDDFNLKRFLKVPQCLTGYMISPTCAKAFIKASSEMFLPVDVFIRHSYLHKQAIYGLTPNLLTHGNVKTSTIGGRKNKIKSLDVKLTKLANRFYSAFYSMFYNIFA